FHSNNPDLRLSDLARLGLVRERQVLSDELIYAVLFGKFRNPMLGLFGAHLLLLKTESAEEKKDLAGHLPVIIGNLRGLFGPRHPDVGALALALGDPPAVTAFAVPPLLRRSWSMIVNATVARPDLVPAGSLSARVADRLLAYEPWLLWSASLVR